MTNSSLFHSEVNAKLDKIRVPTTVQQSKERTQPGPLPHTGDNIKQ